MRIAPKLRIVPILCALSCSRSAEFDDAGYERLLSHSRAFHHVVVGDPVGLREQIVRAISGQHGQRRVLVKHNDQYSLVVEQLMDSNRWVARSFVRMQLPKQADFPDTDAFLRGAVDYYCSQWVLQHPEKPYFFVPAVGLAKAREGVWAMETGPAVVAGHGLRVEVDGDGRPVSITEIFNAD